MMDAIRARTPGLSKDLPPIINRWGEPVSHESGLGKAYDILSPFASRKPASEPIDQEILKQGFQLPALNSRPTIMGEKVNLARDPQMLGRYQQLAGNELKLPIGGEPMGLKDTLNAIVSGEHPYSEAYSRLDDGHDGGKEHMLRDIMERYSKAAQFQLLKEQPDLANLINQKRDARRNAHLEAQLQ
jgi:hypothetical protein